MKDNFIKVKEENVKKIKEGEVALTIENTSQHLLKHLLKDEEKKKPKKRKKRRLNKPKNGKRVWIRPRERANKQNLYYIPAKDREKEENKKKS